MASAAAGLVLSWPGRAGEEEQEKPLSRSTLLAARAQAGDDRAFDELMEATLDRVLNVSWRLLGSREDARDAAQETFLRAYRYLPRFRPSHDFEAWLYRIAVNVCRDAWKRARKASSEVLPLDEERRSGGAVEPASCDDTEARVLERERRSLIMRALATLPDRERAALVLRDLEGKTSEEAARILGSRPGTVRSQLASARAKLKRAIAGFARPEGGVR